MDSTLIEIASAAGGGSTAAALAIRFFISKTLKDLNTALEKINEVEKALINITTRLEEMDRTHSLFRELDRKVVAIETKINGRFNKH